MKNRIPNFKQFILETEEDIFTLFKEVFTKEGNAVGCIIAQGKNLNEFEIIVKKYKVPKTETFVKNWILLQNGREFTVISKQDIENGNYFIQDFAKNSIINF